MKINQICHSGWRSFNQLKWPNNHTDKTGYTGQYGTSLAFILKTGMFTFDVNWTDQPTGGETWATLSIALIVLCSQPVSLLLLNIPDKQRME